MSKSKIQKLTTSTAETILDSISEGVFTVDLDWKITYINKAASKMTGIEKKDAIGMFCSDVFRTNACENNCVLNEVFAKGVSVENRIIYFVNSEGKKITTSVSGSLLKNAVGETIGGVETFRDYSMIESLRNEIKNKRFASGIITSDKKLLSLIEILPMVSESDSNVLILGESGTGKELIARAIHNMSHRKNKQLVVINCAALPETLLESELFGHKAGAFTDARKDKLGRIAVAEGGTIFFDEIGELPLSIQVKLLRLLQEKVYEPLGSNKPVNANVRFVFATNRNLKKMINKGTFREDLYYRINVMECLLPPLRERPSDIVLLAEHFIERFNSLKQKKIAGITPEALNLLSFYEFPGNVRELENIIERAFILCTDKLIGIKHLPFDLQEQANDNSTARAHSNETSIKSPPSDNIVFTTKKNLKQLSDLKGAELDIITRTIKKHDGNKAAAARELGIHPVTLWRKLKKN